MIAGLGIAGFAAAAPTAFVAALLRTSGSALPAGLHVGDVDVGGLEPEDAVAKLDAIWQPYLANPVSFELDGRIWRPSAVDIGLHVDYRLLLRDVVAGQGSGGIARRVSDRPTPAGGAVAVASFNQQLLRAYLAGIAQGFDQPALDAAVNLRGSSAAEVRPDQIGRVVDIEAAVQAAGDLTRPSEPERVITLSFREDVPAVTTDDARAVLDQVALIAGAPLWLMHNGRGWTVSPEAIRNAVRINETAAGLSPALDFTRFNDLFTLIDDTLASEPHPTVFEYDEARDRVLAFEPGNAGQHVDRTALEQAMAQAVTTPNDRAIEIPVILLNKEFDFSQNPLGARDLLGSGDSLYRGSPDYRMHNIAVGAEKLNGQVVQPGDTFSFLDRIGPFRLSEGWVEGSIIVADKTEQGVGGGICQVSTTLFRAVLNAGLEVVKRWPHLYRVRYYEMGPAPIGIDATIFSPGVDLKFRNDTDHPVMLRSRVDEQLASLEFEIWGVSDGRISEIVDHRLWGWRDPPPDEGVVDPEEDPEFEEQAEWAKRGVQASFSRVIVWPDGAEKESTFQSNFLPWPNRFIVGIDEAKARFPSAYNKWFDENPEEAVRWGVSRVPGVPSDPDAPAG